MKFRMVLVLLSCAISVLMGIVIARSGGAGRATGAGHKPLIGLSMDTEKEARWQVDRDIFRNRAAELGAEVLVQSANSDDAQQVKDIDALIARKIDALVIIPHNGAVLAKTVEKAHAAGIPVMAYDRLITGCDLDLYVTFDNVKVGEMQARYVVEHLPAGKGRIVRIYGSKTDNNALLFKQGQDNVLKPSIDRGDIQVLHEDWAEDWKPENGKKIMNAAIAKSGQGRDFDAQAVLVSNDGTAGGAITALSEGGLDGKLLVTGQDADLVACQRIARGTQSMTIYKPIKNLAARAADLAVRMASHRPVVANSTVPNGKIDVPAVCLEVVTVTRSNLVGTVVKDGFHTYDEIYAEVPEQMRPPRP